MKTIFYRHNKSGVAPAVERGEIPFYDLTFVVKGSLFYHIDGQPIVIKTNECIFIPKGALRQRESSHAEYISFNFVDATPNLPIRFCGIPYEVRLLFAVCDELQKKYGDYEEKINVALHLILGVLLEENAKQSQPPVVTHIKNYIRERLSDKLSLSQISAVVGYTPTYCDYLFHKETGCSIMRYVIQERITEAKRLLIEGILPLTDVAFAVGFSDYNYFSRAFKQREGVPPKQFRLHQIGDK